MNETPNPNVGRHSVTGEFFCWLFRRQTQRRALIGFAVLATLVAIFYLEEDWRGKRAWENCKRELEAKGAVLDWEKYVPPPVPDDQNVFKATTNMTPWFVSATTPAEMELANRVGLRLWPTETNGFPVLDTAKTGPIVVATITVIPPDSGTLDSASHRLNLKLSDPGARSQAGEFIQKTIGRSANGIQGFKFSEFQMNNLAIAQIILEADPAPSIAELENLLSANTVTNIGHLRVEAADGKGIYQVVLTGVHLATAADYLKWSDQFEPDFDQIREALQRPYAQIAGDYSRPFLHPIPNFVTMRGVAQTLAQRTQCYLLLGQPEMAFRDAALLHDCRRILERAPTGKPMLLVDSMIDVAVTGLYVNTVAEGLQSHTWREPQLVRLQEQLKGVDLFAFVAESFHTEQAGSCFFMASATAGKAVEMFSSGTAKNKLWQALSNPIFWFYALAPRGWFDQNRSTIATLEQNAVDAVNLADQTFSPQKSIQANSEAEKLSAGRFFSPYSFIAAIAIPNFIRAWQTTARNQTLVNEGQIACALERYHLAHGEYPEALDTLVPQFIEKLPHDIIGGQPLHYRRTADGNFLLYSVGWNEIDDGGTASDKMDQGDWVWKN